MAGAAKRTIDHDEIRGFVENLGGKPACVRGTGDKGDIGLLRIDFPDGPEPNLQQISWEDFFRKFEQSKLAFLYQEKGGGGQPSRFVKLVRRNAGEQQEAAPQASTAQTPSQTEGTKEETTQFRSHTHSTLEELMLQQLSALLDAELSLFMTLQSLENIAHAPSLRQAIREHAGETREHAQRIEELIGQMDLKPVQQECLGMAGLLEELETMLDQEQMVIFSEMIILDACRKVEHYEIAAYENLIFTAQQLGLLPLVDTLELNVRQEREQLDRLDRMRYEVAARTEQQLMKA